MLDTNKPAHNTEAPAPARPLTFAEAMMSTKRSRGGRKDNIKTGDASLLGPISLESLGPSKYTFKRKKKQNKWSPFDLSVAESSSEAGSNSEVGINAGSSRGVSPWPQPSFGSALFPSSPQRSTSTLAVVSTTRSDGADKLKDQLIEEADLELKKSRQSHRTTAQNSVVFLGEEVQDQVKHQLFGKLSIDLNSAGSHYQSSTQNKCNLGGREANNNGKCRFIEETNLAFHKLGTSCQTLTKTFPKVAVPLSLPVLHDAVADLVLTRLGHNCAVDTLEAGTSDPEFTKYRAQAAMASIAEAFGGKAPNAGENLFDYVEWSPDLPSASAPDSPELAEAVNTPQVPRAYTTVGSIINPNAVPQFTAPNRIQREGAGRRPLMSFTQSRHSIPNRHQDTSFFHPRDPLPLLKMQDSMHYAQQLSNSPVRLFPAQQPIPSHSSRSHMSCQQMILTNDEIKVLKRMERPQMVAGNIAISPASSNQPQRSFSSMILSENTQLADHLSTPEAVINSSDLTFSTLLSTDPVEDGQRQSTALSGLEKMRTIQHLAKFDNPMQELARSRLSALSVSNVLSRSVANPDGLSASLSSKAETVSHKITAARRGMLDRGYQSPPLGFGHPSSHENPLAGACVTSIYGAAPSTRSLGVPQPLTAGPPGQRQHLTSGTSKMITSFTEPRQLESDMNVCTAYDGYWQKGTVDRALQLHLPIDSHPTMPAIPNLLGQDLKTGSLIPAISHQSRDPVFDCETVGSRLVDSLPVSAVLKYYPHGLPHGMTGQFTSLPGAKMMKMAFQKFATADEKKATRRREMNDWFYAGQQDYGKTTTDHINDMAYREDVRRGGMLGPSRTPPKKVIEKQPITEQEMKVMTTADATKPLIDMMFRTLLAYADETFDTESRRHLSGFVMVPEFLIDHSDVGNVSFFGEDWGVPPKHVAGCSRPRRILDPASTIYKQ